MARGRTPDLTPGEAARIRPVLLRLYSEKYGSNKAEAGRQLGKHRKPPREFAGPTITQQLDGDATEAKNSPSRELAIAVAREAGLPDLFWQDGFLETAQLHPMGVRLVLHRDIAVIQRGEGEPVAEQMRRLSGKPDAVQRAIVAVAHLTGHSLEQVIDAAETAISAELAKKKDVEDQDPDFWYAKIRDNLRGQPGDSGTYHAVKLRSSSLPSAASDIEADGPPTPKPPRARN